MTTADNLALAEGFYQARGDRGVIDQVMSQDVVWDITPGFPLGGVYHGLDSVLSEFLAPVASQFESMAARPEQLLADAESHVIVLGHYVVTSKSGEAAHCRFVHLWTVTDGRLSHLHHTADTAVLHALLGETPR